METNEQKRRRAYGVYSDLFKDLHGIRPRWAADYSLERLEAGIEEVCNELEAEAAPVERDWLTLDVSDPTFSSEYD